MKTGSKGRPPRGQPDTLPSFAALAKAEPRLNAMYRELRAVKPGRNFCANAIWYGYGKHHSYRTEVARLVGWNREEHALLGTSAAYDAAYDTLYSALPDCRGACECSRVFTALTGMTQRSAHDRQK